MTQNEHGLSTLGEAAQELAQMGFSVVRLHTGGKEPNTRHGVKDATRDADTIAQWWTQYNNANIGIACGEASGGLFVIDVDCGHSVDDCGEPIDGMDVIKAWERDHSPLAETVTATTASGGYHIYYRTSERIPNHVNSDVGIDFRGDGGYVVAPPSTLRDASMPYMWECAPNERAVAEADANVLAFVHSLIGNTADTQDGQPFVLPDVIKKGERDDTLLKAGCSMRAKRVPPDIIGITMRGINAERCVPPMEPYEVEHVFQSVLAHPEGRSKQYDDAHPQFKYPEDVPTLKDAGVVSDKGKLDTTAFAYYLTEHFYACHVNEVKGDLAVWDGTQYQTDEMIKRFITQLYDRITIHEENELLHTLENIAPVHKEAPTNFIAFKNGIYNIDTAVLSETTPEYLIVNTIPHNFVLERDTTEMRNVLNDYACGNNEVLLNLQEVIGACMWRSVDEYGQCVILIGRGANGKSTYMTMLKTVLGHRNYTNLDIHLLGERFQTTHLYGKLADFSDDIASAYLTKNTLSDFKKAITGNGVAGERKNKQDMIEFEPYTTFVISSNEMPRFAETTEGMERRLHAIPFNASYRVGNSKHDKRILKRLTSEDACEQLIQLGIWGIASLREQGQFTPNEISKQMVHAMMVESDSVLQWIEIKGIELGTIVGQPVDSLYADYKSWAGEKHVGQPRFQTKMKERFPVDIVHNNTRKKNYFHLANGGNEL